MKKTRFQPLIAALIIAFISFGSAQAQAPIHVKTKPAKSTIPSTTTSHSAEALTEGFYFLMNDYKMEHQGETNTLNIKVSYSYVRGIADDQYPDFIPIRKDVDKFLTEYPNEMTFWEILNKQLTSRLIEKYPALASVTCEIQVTPSSKYPFTRGSVVTRVRRELAKIEHSNKNYRRKQ